MDKLSFRAGLQPVPDHILDEHILGMPERLFDLLPMAVYACDRDGIILRYNRRAVELWGRAPEPGSSTERFCGSYRLYRLDGGPVAHAECPVADVLRTGDPVRDQEIVIERPDGSRAVALINIDAVKDSAGNVIGVINILQDITARKRSEHELRAARQDVVATAQRAEATVRESEQRFREVLNTIPAAVYTTDAAGRITYYNQAAVALWGCQPELGKTEFCGSWRLYWSDGQPMRHDQCPMAVALKESRPVIGLEAVAERPDGTRVPFKPYPIPLYDASGALTGAVNMLVDLTEIRRGEELAARLAAIVESSHDAIVSKDLDGTIVSWNRSAEDLFGYEPEEAIGKSVYMLIPPDRADEEPAIIERVRRGERVDTYETVRRRKDGSPVDVSLTVSPIKDAAGRVIGASKIARDITDRKQADARQRLLIRELNHRVKNVLATVQAVMASTARASSSLEEFHRSFGGRIAALARTHALLTEEQWRTVRLQDLLRAELEPYEDDSGRRVRLSGPPVELSSDLAAAIGMAIHELTTNAAKHGALSELGGWVEVAWGLAAENGSRMLWFEWTERNGPPVVLPSRKGFGSRLLQRVLTTQLDAQVDMDFAPDGLRVRAVVPLPSDEAV